MSSRETFACVVVAWNRYLSFEASVPPSHPPPSSLKLFITALRVLGSYKGKLLAFSGDFLFSQIRFCFIMGSEGVSSSVLGSVFI